MPTITKLPSGKYRVQVRKQGVYRAKTFSTKTLANQWGANLEAQIESSSGGGFIAPPKTLTVGELIDGYNKMEERLKWGRTKTMNLRKLKLEMGHVGVKTFNQIHIREFLDKIIKDGAGGATCAGYLSTLGSVLSWAHHTKRINVDPNLHKSVRASLTHQGLKLSSNERSRLPTDAELKAMYDDWEKNSLLVIPIADITTLAIETAMRMHEICHVLIDDCDFEKRTVLIRDRKSPTEKIGNNQIIPISEKAVEVLKRHAGDRTGERVFPNLNHRSISARFTRTVAKLGIEDLHFHDLRHMALTNFAKKGLTLPELSLISGHKSYDMLKRYVNIQAKDLFNKI